MSSITTAQATAKKPKRRRKKKEPAAYLLAATEQAATVNAESTFLGAMNTLINFRSFSLVALPGERAGWVAAHARPACRPEPRPTCCTRPRACRLRVCGDHMRLGQAHGVSSRPSARALGVALAPRGPVSHDAARSYGLWAA